MRPQRGPRTVHRFVEVDGVRVFYRESGPPDAPTMLLLHGFPSASHQFRRLIDALGDGYRLIAPDYPGFGHSEAPESTSTGGPFSYTFERLTDVIEGFCKQLALSRFVAYVFDFGGPVGMRLADRHPDWLAGLTLAVTRDQYLGGAGDPDAIAPDGWTLDQHFLDLPGRKQIQLDLAFDYHTNIALYPRWQAWLHQHQPPTLVVWGRGDPFFLETGAQAYRRDLPDAEVHLFDTGHFALEEKLPDIAPLISDFLDRTWA